MKKLILFLSVISFALLVTSCIDEGGNNYTDSTYVYIDMSDNGVMYGKTISPYTNMRFITNPNMTAMIPGEIKVMSYSWDEEYGTTALSISGETVQADNVRLAGESFELKIEPLIMDIEAPEVEEPKKFLEIAAPLYADNKEFMNDNWIVQYAYEAGKDQIANVEFYKREGETIVGNNIIIAVDVHLTLTGPSEGTALEPKASAIALNMSQLRAEYEESSDSSTKNLKVEFYYYLKGLDGKQKSQQTYSLTIGG